MRQHLLATVVVITVGMVTYLVATALVTRADNEGMYFAVLGLPVVIVGEVACYVAFRAVAREPLSMFALMAAGGSAGALPVLASASAIPVAHSFEVDPLIAMGIAIIVVSVLIGVFFGCLWRAASKRGP